MRFAARRGLVLVACVSAGFAISAGPGLVARAAEPDRWLDALGAHASATATLEQAAQGRIAELEQRIRELEAERPARQTAGKSPDVVTTVKRNEELGARHRALSIEHQELAQACRFERSDLAPAAAQPSNTGDPRAQLRYWAKQLRDDENNSRKMSPEWNAAVNVLLRGERQLDPQNPWR